MKIRVVFFGCVVGLLFPLDSVADVVNKDTEMFKVVVTGSRIPVNDKNEKSNVEIITREEIQRQNPRSVMQLLQNVAGLYVENSGSRGGVGAVYLRGAESNYTLVMIDGVSVNDPTNSRGGAYDFSLLNINNVEKIEIVKGPVSFVYGSAAMAGVINIVTRKNLPEPKTTMKVELGSSGFANVNVSSGVVSENAEVSVLASYEKDGEQVEGREYNAKAVSMAGALDYSAATEISFNARYQDSSAETFPEASGGDTYSVLRELDQRDSQQQQLGVSLKHQIGSEQFLQVDASYSKMEEDYTSPGVDTFIPINESDSDYERQSISAQYRFQPAKLVQTSVGVVAEREEGDSRGKIDFGGFVLPTQFKLERDVHAIFTESQYQPVENIVWSIGVRADKPNEFDTEMSPHIGVSYTHTATQYALNWGKGFKLPSFFALAHPLVGNPDFGPETNENYDFSVKHKLTEQTSVKATIFQSQYFDLIDFGDSGVLVSRDEVNINGIELGISSGLLENVFLNANFSALDMDIKNSEEMLSKRPKRSGGVRLNWKATHRVNIFVGANYIGEVRDFSFPTGERVLSAYTRVDTSVQWRIMDGLDGLLAIDNLLDKKYDESVGMEAAGAVLRVAIQGEM